MFLHRLKSKAKENEQSIAHNTKRELDKQISIGARIEEYRVAKERLENHKNFS